jgi:hypothetical protein
MVALSGTLALKACSPYPIAARTSCFAIKYVCTRHVGAPPPSRQVAQTAIAVESIAVR